MLKVLEKINTPLKTIIMNRRLLNRQEENLYVGAFLSIARERLLEKLEDKQNLTESK